MSLETSLRSPSGRTLIGTVRPLVTLTLLSIAVVALGCRVLPWRNLFPDFICYWTAAELVASGHSVLKPRPLAVRPGKALPVRRGFSGL